jgi:competence protein ComEA
VLIRTSAKCWIVIVVILTIIIVIGGVIACSRYQVSQPIEISSSSNYDLHGSIYVGGSIGLPGWYPFRAEDTIEDIIKATGGYTGEEVMGKIELYVSFSDEEQQPQKVNINRAENWLLEALPGIGEVTAQTIIDYRDKHGQFDNTYELTRVEGIGIATYEQIKHLITVAD